MTHQPKADPPKPPEPKPQEREPVPIEVVARWAADAFEAKTASLTTARQTDAAVLAKSFRRKYSTAEAVAASIDGRGRLLITKRRLDGGRLGHTSLASIVYGHDVTGSSMPLPSREYMDLLGAAIAPFTPEITFTEHNLGETSFTIMYTYIFAVLPAELDRTI